MQEHADVVIIGGGAVGVCCAYYLQSQGREVLLVDKGDVCSGASYGNAGLIVPSYSIPLAAPGVISQCIRWLGNAESPFYVKPSPRLSLLRWMWKFSRFCNTSHVHKSIPILRDLTRESLGLFRELNCLEGLDFGFEQKGLLELFRTKKGFEEGREAFGLLQRFGIGGEILRNAQIEQFSNGLGVQAVGGIFFHEDALIVPDRFVRQLAEYVARNGVRLATNVGVIGFEKSARRIKKVCTTKGDISVGSVVIAAGAWSSLIARDLNVRLMIEPAKGYSITFRKPKRCVDIPCSLAEARVVITPMGNFVRFAGTLEMAGFNESINTKRVEAIEKSVAQYLPELDLEGKDLIEIWQGFRPCTPDGLPYIGKPQSYDNVVVASGHGMLGISLAPATGKLVSQILTNERPFVDLTPFRIERFA